MFLFLPLPCFLLVVLYISRLINSSQDHHHEANITEEKTFTLSLNICPKGLLYKSMGPGGETSSPYHHPISQLIRKYFKDDVTVIILPGVSFIINSMLFYLLSCSVPCIPPRCHNWRHMLSKMLHFPSVLWIQIRRIGNLLAKGRIRIRKINQDPETRLNPTCLT